MIPNQTDIEREGQSNFKLVSIISLVILIPLLLITHRWQSSHRELLEWVEEVKITKNLEQATRKIEYGASLANSGQYDEALDFLMMGYKKNELVMSKVPASYIEKYQENIWLSKNVASKFEPLQKILLDESISLTERATKVRVFFTGTMSYELKSLVVFNYRHAVADNKISSMQNEKLDDIIQKNTQSAIVGYSLFIACFVLFFSFVFQLNKTLGENRNFSNLLKQQNTKLQRHEEQLTLEVEQKTQQYKVAARRAESASKAKSAFFAGMSHELRTPLHGIKSFAYFGMEDCKSKSFSDCEDHFREIHTSAMRLMDTLTEILDLSKLEANKMVYEITEVSLAQVCSEVCSEFDKFAASRRMKFETSKEIRNLALVLADEKKLAQVVRNLLSNAIKYGKMGTTIFLDPYMDTNKSVSGISISNYVEQSLDEELDFLFEPFVRGKQGYSQVGTGLGLPICKKLIKDLKGDIVVSSSLEKVKFTFWFPVNKVIDSVA